MEDSFRVRVEKAFGSLPSPSSSTDLWCVSGEEIEKREWNRRDSGKDSDDEPPLPTHRLSGLQEPHNKPSQEEEEEEEEEEEDDDDVKPLPLLKKDAADPGPGPGEDWEIRASIGLDCTLDYEEEEDEFDKVAVGLEGFRDSLYARDIDDYGIDFHYPEEIPCSFNRVIRRDPRANHVAAKLRLMEDSDAAGDFDSSKLPNVRAPPSITQQLEDGTNPKPILKRRESTVDTRPHQHKRVRFFGMSSLGTDTSQCSEKATSPAEEEAPQEPILLGQTKAAEYSTSLDESSLPKEESISIENFPQVPDYIRNPSRYTHYTLDSADDVEDSSNKKAYMDFVKLLKEPKGADVQPDDREGSFPELVIFTPKKKMDDSSLMIADAECRPNHGEVLNDKAFPAGIAAAEAHDDGVCAMDEDVQEIVANTTRGSHKPSRQYRSRTAVIYDDCID